MKNNNKSVKYKDSDTKLNVRKISQTDKTIALAGNPNVGKSTVFNALTGMKQHTGNWAGKTVANAQGICSFNNINYILADIPGTYSLMSHSKEEEIARDFICFENPDGVIVVCDASCLERNLNLVLQTLEITNNVVVCVNLMDEAEKKDISVDLNKLSELLGVPVVGTSARHKKGLDELMNSVEKMLDNSGNAPEGLKVKYAKSIENAVSEITPVLAEKLKGTSLSVRWTALRLLENNSEAIESIYRYAEINLLDDEEIIKCVQSAKEVLAGEGIDGEKLKDYIVSSIIITAEGICNEAVSFNNKKYNIRDRRIDKLLTNKVTGIPIMLLMLAVIFWITISGANYPSQLLSSLSFYLEEKALNFCIWAGVPKFIYEMLILGVYRVLAWVVSVMLPPMAIFFPLFTLLEDFGILPRIAFNMDKTFKKCCACGKQALTMCMGFGCNAVGIVGCRIIDSPRERLIAMLTNNFVPCNGRFPTMIAIITMFFTFSAVRPVQSFIGTLLLTIVILIGICLTFIISKLLSKTILKGEPSSFTLELPPYRRPEIGKVLIRSILDRTLFVLGRAVTAAAPAGLIIWLFANITIDNITILSYLSQTLDPFARLLGMDGVILLAFILGIPANEIVLPIIIMAYISNGSITDMSNLTELKQLLTDNGWTWITAVSTILFSLMHWPCATTLMTIKKESGSFKWTVLAFLIPALSGIVICFLFNTIASLF